MIPREIIVLLCACVASVIAFFVAGLFLNNGYGDAEIQMIFIMAAGVGGATVAFYFLYYPAA